MSDEPGSRPGVPAGSVGTRPLDHPVTREELERALRRLTLSIETVRDDVMQLAAQVVATSAALAQRLDGAGPDDDPLADADADAASSARQPLAAAVERQVPAARQPLEAAVERQVPAALEPLEAAVERQVPAALDEIRGNDEGSMARLLIGAADDKYAASSRGPDCVALLPICQGRCCTFHFALSTQDLDEGVIRWDYGKPYLVKQRVEDGYCVHSDPAEHRCTVYAHRPRPCRRYDCRDDRRIWADFERRVLATDAEAMTAPPPATPPPGEPVCLADRVQARQLALAMETFSLNTGEAARGRLEAHARRDLDAAHARRDLDAAQARRDLDAAQARREEA